MGDEVRDQKWGSMIRRLIVKEQNQDVFFSSAGRMQKPGMGSGYHQRDVVLLA